MTDFDLFSRRFKRDPFPTFARLRAEAPVYRHEAPNGVTIWYVSRYEDVVEVLRDERFVKNLGNAVPPEGVRERATNRNVLHLINQNMLFEDPPRHTRLRALVSQAFTPRRIAALEPRIQAVADALLRDEYASGAMDLIDRYAFPLPVIVIMELLGVPAAEREQVRDWSGAIIAPGSRGINNRQRKRRIQAFVDYLITLCRARERAPQDDLLSDLVQARDGAGDRLNEEELAGMGVLLLVTGHETVINLIGNGALALLQHPEQRALALSSPALLASAVEELLRFDGPVETSTTRWAREDLDFRGQRIQRGDLVRVVLASANRDPAIFNDPERLDVTRDPNPHLAFGRGVHYCLGAPLARLEGRIALGTLFGTLPDLAPAVPAHELQWRSGVLFRGLKTLPVRWTVS
jgi:cytochrome P450 PksS